MFRDLKIIIPAAVIFLLILLGVYQLYQRTVTSPQEPTPIPAAQFPSKATIAPTPTPATTTPNSQPATGVTTLPATGIR